MSSLLIKKNLDYVDLLKAIAIFFVLVYHFSIINTDFIHKSNFSSYFNYYLKSILSTCVPLFFIVNGGLLFNKNDLDIKKHIIKIFKIVILTLVWSLITLLLFSVIKNEHISAIQLLGGLYFLKQGWTNHLWFFKALIVLYIFYPIIFTAYKHEKTYFNFFLISVFIFTFFNGFIGDILSTLSILTEKFTEKKFNSINYFNEFNPFRSIYGYSIFYFLLGGLLFKYSKKLNTKSFRLISIFVIPISMFFLFSYFVLLSSNSKKIWDIVWNSYDSIFTLLNVTAIFIIVLNYKHKGVVGKVVRLIGTNTMGIYLIHIIIGTIILPFFSLKGVFANLLFAVVLLFISLSITLILKKIPGIRKLVLI